MTKFRSYLTLLLFILVVSAVSFSAAQFPPGEWYVHLIKPDWTPPDWIFPVVWTVLYLMIAVAGWLIFMGSGRLMNWSGLFSLSLTHFGHGYFSASILLVWPW